jgi:hypothetical protein
VIPDLSKDPKRRVVIAIGLRKAKCADLSYGFRLEFMTPNDPPSSNDIFVLSSQNCSFLADFSYIVACRLIISNKTIRARV